MEGGEAKEEEGAGQGRAGGLFTSAAAKDLWGVWIGRHRLRLAAAPLMMLY